MYNIVRVYSCKSSDVNNSDVSNVNPISAPERDPEALPTFPTGPMVIAENNLQTNDHVHRLEIDHTLPDRNTKVVFCSNMMRDIMRTFLYCMSYVVI